MKWLEQNKNTVLIILLGLFLLLLLFYFFMVRPLAAEEETQRQELNRINEDVSFYQNRLDQLTPQQFTAEEKNVLVGSIPAKPSVEDIIKDLERTELDTGVVIDNIAFSIHPNELKQENAETEAVEEGQQEQSVWQHILPSESLEIVETKLADADIDDIVVSYVEMVIDVNGESADVHQFVDQLENLQRIIHVQSYDYSINEEKDNRLEGIVTIRAFYSENFAELLEEEVPFELDYVFDPSKIKRYKEPVEQTEDSSETEDPTDSGANNANVEGVPQEEVNLEPSTANKENPREIPSEKGGSTSKDKSENATATEQKTKDKADSKLPLYNAPEAKYDGNPVFRVVQTGAYVSTDYLYLAAKDLADAGVYPRMIGDDKGYIYTATDSGVTSVQKIVEILKDKGFDSYVKTLPYRLTEEEKETLLPAAEDLVSTITKMVTNGIVQESSVITEGQVNTVQTKIKEYDDRVQILLKNTGSEQRKQELLETLSILSEIENIVIENVKNQELDSLWEVEGRILDYMLIFNGYVPADLKDR